MLSPPSRRKRKEGIPPKNLGEKKWGNSSRFQRSALGKNQPPRTPGRYCRGKRRGGNVVHPRLGTLYFYNKNMLEKSEKFIQSNTNYCLRQIHAPRARFMRLNDFCPGAKLRTEEGRARAHR